jgi:hypothetical protein
MKKETTATSFSLRSLLATLRLLVLILCSACQNVVIKTDNRDWYQANLPGLEPDVVLQCIDPRVGTPERNYPPLQPPMYVSRGGRKSSNSCFRRMGAASRQAGNIGRRASLQHGCSRPWWLVARASEECVIELECLQKINDMQQCGICSVLADLFRRIMCIGGSRRGSGDSYYQELEEEEVSSCLIYVCPFVNRRGYEIHPP